MLNFRKYQRRGGDWKRAKFLIEKIETHLVEVEQKKTFQN